MKPNHQTFIIEMMKHGDKALAYTKAYSNSKGGETARKAAERLLRHNPAIVAEIEEAAAHMRHSAYTEAYRLHVEQQKVPLLSMLKRREILAQIACRQVKVCRYVKDDGGYRMLFEDIRPRDMIRAIEVDAKMEDACNRARNFTDPVLAQFNIYIDGRPCDDPTAPANPDLPPGIVMLPKRKKDIVEISCTSSHPETNIGGSVIEEKSTQETGNIPETSANKTNETPHEISLPDIYPATSGRAIGGKTNDNPRETSIAVSAIAEQSTQDLSHTTLSIPQSSPLYPQYLALLEKRELYAQDPLYDSFCKQAHRAEESAPPPHIYTDEEVKAIEAEYAGRHNASPPRYSTFGKMYFPEKTTVNFGPEDDSKH